MTGSFKRWVSTEQLGFQRIVQSHWQSVCNQIWHTYS